MNLDFKLTPWAIASTYGIVNSFIYSWFFWIKFNINILQFASFSDLLPSILYILAIPCLAMSIGSSAIILWEESRDKIEEFLLRVIRRWTTKCDFLAVLSPVLLPLALLIIYIIYTRHGDIKINNEVAKINNPDVITDYILIIVVMLSCITSGYVVQYKTSFMSHLKKYRKITIMTIFAIPYICYATAIINANNIIIGSKTYLVSTDSLCSDKPGEHFRYISSISDKAFSMSLTDGSICVFKYNFLKLTPEINKDYKVTIDTNMT